MELIVVESPTKARTLSKFLGSKYAVEATNGHIRDLPQKKLGVDVKKDFELEYVQTDKQKERVKEIKRLSDQADKVYLATDPDREGEAIAWHTAEMLQKKTAKRVVFHEITERAIREAIDNPRALDMPLVNAQQARRVLDRLVGYKLSPLLWRKVRKGLSAGRVQSVAVRLVVEKEREIEAFKPEEYWQVAVDLEKGQKFTAMLVDKVGNGEEAGSVKTNLERSTYTVTGVEKREFKRTPSAPFTTSTLQQTAANRLGWSAKKTMQVAQSLYEEGYITYHRTDSTNLAQEATAAVKEYVTATYGAEFAVETARVYKTKNKVAQEAHEAIRPTNVTATVQDLNLPNRDQHKLYELIWRRFVGCQMAEVRGLAVKVVVAATGSEKEYRLEARGETVTFEGWTKLYQTEESEEKEEKLPELAEGDVAKLIEVRAEQKFTQPPARYNDASLIKTLEEMGIGRPSTYAPTLTTIQERQYVEKTEKRFRPTALGVAVNDFLVANFSKIVDYQFTADMEYGLDEIANGEREWQPMIRNFYTPFAEDLKRVEGEVGRVKVEVEKTGEMCPECHEGDVVVRIGKFGKFLSCSRYPECKYKANFQNKVGVKCSKCGDGDVIVRRTRSGRSFYGCSNYPKCDFASWTKPVVSVGSVASAEK